MALPVSVALKVGTIPGTALLVLSLRVIVTVEVATPLATTGPVPVIDELMATGPPDWKTTVPPVFTTGVAIAKVLVSATLDLKVQVETPEALELVQVLSVLPVPVAVKVGTVPATLLLLASFSVMVMVDVEVLSAAIGPVPVMVEFNATAAPAVKVMALPVLIIGVAKAMVLISALVDLKVHVETPLASVEEQVPRVLPVPVDEKVGTVPATGLLLESLNVIVTVEVAVLSATTGEVPTMVEFATDGAPAVKVTVPPSLVTGKVSCKVLTPATVDCMVHVDTPLASPTVQVS